MIAVAGVAILPLVLTACGGSSGGDAGTGSSSKPAAKAKVGVILPDATTSPRWENNDRPALQKAITDAGFTAVIQNASKDVTKFATLCDSMINQGVKVLMIVNLDSAVRRRLPEEGRRRRHQEHRLRPPDAGRCRRLLRVVRQRPGRQADGPGPRRLPDRRRQDQGNIAIIDGDPTDNNAALFKQGYISVLQPKFDSKDYTNVGEQTGKWDAAVAQQAFQQIFTQAGGKVDGVISANDTMAGGVVKVLTDNKLAGTVPVTGQDASDEGLQRVLAGTQCGTVFKDVNLEAEGGVHAGDRAAEERRLRRRAGQRLGQGHHRQPEVKSVFATPVWVTKANIKVPFDAGYTTPEGLHDGLPGACKTVGLTS